MTPAASAERRWLDRFLLQEDVNFLLTNRIPRLAATRFMGWFSRIESPLLTALSIRVWRLFAPLDLSEAQPARYRSLRECFIRELQPGTRPLESDPCILASPCDAIIGACGRVEAGRVFQTKGFPYTLADLFGDSPIGRTRSVQFHEGSYVTLRLTSTMYHRFHAPHDGRLTHLSYFSGDTWNVNPIALKRVEKLFCKNERAALDMQLHTGERITLVPVAAVLVASMRFHCAALTFNAQYSGAQEIPLDTCVSKGEELGWFEHGSTIIVFLPPGLRLAERVVSGVNIRMGEALACLPA